MLPLTADGAEETSASVIFNMKIKSRRKIKRTSSRRKELNTDKQVQDDKSLSSIIIKDKLLTKKRSEEKLPTLSKTEEKT